MRFDEVFDDRTKYGTKIKTDEYRPQGKTIIIDQGQALIAGYTDRQDGAFTDVPAIVFGDHTRVIKYIDKPFFLGADGVKVLKSKLPNTNYRYLYYALLYARIPNTGYNRHFKWLKELDIYYPALDVQKRVVAILDRVIVVISLYRQQLAKLDELVKARFVEMFGDPVKNNRVWDRQEMYKVAPIKTVPGIKTGRTWLLNLDVIESNTGRIIDYFYTDVSSVGASTYAFDTDNVLYSKLRPYLNKVVVPTQGGYCTTELIPLRPNEKLNKQFLAYLLRSDAFVAYINEKVTGAKMPRVSMDLFKGFKCILPPIDLQNQFAAFVTQVEKSKAAVQRALDKAQLLFDSLMQQYFG